MSEENTDETEAPKKKGGIMLPLIFGLVGAAALGGATAFTVGSGIVDVPGFESAPVEGDKAAKVGKKSDEPDKPKPAFVPLETLSINLAPNGSTRAPTLRIDLTLETTSDDEEAVFAIVPRVYDQLNTMLRAIDHRDLSDPTALDRLRAQMMRRVRLVVEGATINDVLIVNYIIL